MPLYKPISPFQDAFSQLQLICRCLPGLKDKKVAELTIGVLRELMRGIDIVNVSLKILLFYNYNFVLFLERIK